MFSYAQGKPIHGGLLMAHCAMAAASGVVRGMVLHCLHAHFLSAGQDLDQKVTYKVTSLSVTRTFAIYTVTATQNGKTLLHATTSFQKENNADQSLTHVALPATKLEEPSPSAIDDVALHRDAAGRPQLNGIRIGILGSSDAINRGDHISSFFKIPKFTSINDLETMA